MVAFSESFTTLSIHLCEIETAHFTLQSASLGKHLSLFPNY